MPHIVEIDQSQRVDQPGATFLAFSNHTSYSIKIPSKVKRAGWGVLKAKGVSSKTIGSLLWTGCVFLLLRDHLGNLSKEADRIIIDNEFAGHEDDIRGALLMHIKKNYGDFPVEKIKIGSIGKKSSAHKLAWATRRKKVPVGKTIKEEELLKVLV